MSTRQHTRELLAQFNRYPHPPPPNRYTLIPISDCDAAAAKMMVVGIRCILIYYIVYTLLFVGDE